LQTELAKQRQTIKLQKQNQLSYPGSQQKATGLYQQYAIKQKTIPEDQLINTRPLNENPALQQMIMHSNEASASSIPLTETKAFLDKVQELQQMAKQLKKMKGLDDVDATSALIARAAKLSGNHSKEFIFLMNEVLFGTNQNIPGLDNLGITPARHFKRIHIGDQGMNSLYQDGEDVQMSHFWGYVNYGYFVPKDIVKAANFFHEYLPGPKRFGSQEDYRLGVVGYNVGQALAKSNISPLELSDRLDMILRSTQFNVILDDDPWLKALPKAQK